MPKKKGKNKNTRKGDEDDSASISTGHGSAAVNDEPVLSKKQRQRLEREAELARQMKALAVDGSDASEDESEDEDSADNTPTPGMNFGALEGDSSDDDIRRGKGKKNKKDKKAKKSKSNKAASPTPTPVEEPEQDEADLSSAQQSNNSADVQSSSVDAADSTGKSLGAAVQNQQLAKALTKREEGKKLSNREKRLVAQYDEEQASAAARITARANDEYGLENFSLSQATRGAAGENMLEHTKDVIVEDFTISAYKKELFVGARLHIVHGRRYGLVGPNGQGKSTLLKYMGARQLAIPPAVDVLYVEQEVVADETRAIDAVLKADKKRDKLLKDEDYILKTLEAVDAGTSSTSYSEEEIERMELRLQDIYDEMSSHNVEKAEPKARKILAGLGFTPEMQERPTRHFSGGWRMRISLARALFIEPTLLLLDEPTNHLDLNAVIWLDDYLQRWKNTLLVVSHDQDFLSSVVTDIIHLENKKLHYYRGDYDSFKAQHEKDVERRKKDYEKQQKQIRALKQKGHSKKQAEAKAKAGAAASGKKGKDSGVAADDNRANELLSRPRDYNVNFAFDEVPELAPPVIEVRDVSFRYGEKYPWLFKNVSFGVDQDSRISIVGPNGVGKSTLIRIITGDLNPPIGEVLRNRFLRVGVYSQHFVDVLPMDQSPVDFLTSQYGDLSYQQARNLLGRYGLEGHAHTIAAADLSGGQKARVVFANLNLMKAHILFLDEPTNHLDIESIDALADGINNFNGGVVLVSHDARLIQATNCRLWVCNDQTVTAWDGEFDDYRDSLMKDMLEEERKLEALAEQAAHAKEEARMRLARQRQAKIQAARAKAGKPPLTGFRSVTSRTNTATETPAVADAPVESAPSVPAPSNNIPEANDDESEQGKSKALKSFFKAPKKKKDKSKKDKSKKKSSE